MSNLDDLQKYRVMYDITMSKLETLLSEEFIQYNDFLEELDISSLPDGLYRYDGDWINVVELRKFYDEWRKKVKK